MGEAIRSEHSSTGNPHKWVPLIRFSHIVSSAVRQVLEEDPLREAGGERMTPRQLHLLEFIAGSGHHIDDAAKFLRVTPPAATKAVDRLEKLGLVARGGCEGDRRLTVLSCTEEGRQLVMRYRALQQETVAKALGTLSEGDVEALTRTLERYSLALVANDGRGFEICLRCSGYYDRDCPLQHTQRGCAYAAAGGGDS
jgi:DNA-binding MarR family transcriptional regulator